MNARSFPHTDMRTGLRYRIVQVALPTRTRQKTVMHLYENGSAVPLGQTPHLAWITEPFRKAG